MTTPSSTTLFNLKDEELQNQMNPKSHSVGGTSDVPPIAVAPSMQKKRSRNQPGNPNSDSEVIALSPETLMATNRFVCEVCNKGFQREQNLQLHRRGHNLPWKLRQHTTKGGRRKVYVCPEPSCVHHDPSRALGDLTGVKKHYARKHGEKIYKCEKCSKFYAVESDCKAHTKKCGTKEYKCECGNVFTRRNSFITHRAFCDAVLEESVRTAPVALTHSTVGNSSRVSVGISSHMVGPDMAQDQIFKPKPSTGILHSSFWPNNSFGDSPFFFPEESNQPGFQGESSQRLGFSLSRARPFRSSEISNSSTYSSGFTDTISLYNNNVGPQFSATSLFQNPEQISSTSSNGSTNFHELINAISVDNNSSIFRAGSYGKSIINFEQPNSVAVDNNSSIFGSGSYRNSIINFEQPPTISHHALGFSTNLDLSQLQQPHINFHDNHINVGASGSDFTQRRDFPGIKEMVRSVSSGRTSQQQRGMVDKSALGSKATMTRPSGQNFHE